MFGVLAVTAPSSRSYESLMVAGKKDACLCAVRQWISMSCLECPLLQCQRRHPLFVLLQGNYRIRRSVWNCCVVRESSRAGQSKAAITSCQHMLQTHRKSNTFLLVGMSHNSVQKLAQKISTDSKHVFHSQYELSPCRRRHCVHKCRTKRCKRSIVTNSVQKLNKSRHVVR